MIAGVRQRLRQLWQDVNGSLWFVPGMIVLGAMALAVGLVALEGRIGDDLFARWPLVFGAGRDASREMLSAVASSMISVAGVVFSITVVVLSLASSQYTPRLLRNFMRDRATQRVFGIFVGIYVYCLLVLRTIYDADGTTFVPRLAVLGGMVLALVGVAFLVSFIHHIAQSIQASHILARIHDETEQVIDRLFPYTLTERAQQEVASGATVAMPETSWVPVHAKRSGYLQQIDFDALFGFARKHDVVVRLDHAIGDYVIEGLPVFSLSHADPIDAARALCDVCVLSAQRTVDQDAGFGFRQIVDVALKGLSPSINDPTTATMCIDRLESLLVRLGLRHIEPSHRFADGHWWVIATGPSFADLLDLALQQIIENAADKPWVLKRLLRLCATLLRLELPPDRRSAVGTHLGVIEQVIQAGLQRSPGCGPLVAEVAHLRVRARLGP